MMNLLHSYVHKINKLTTEFPIVLSEIKIIEKKNKHFNNLIVKQAGL